MNTERKALCWLFVIIAVVVLALLLYSTGDAKSSNQREWLLEYEQVSGYPAPALEPTAVYEMGYPAPALEPTATAKPKKQEPEPTKQEPTLLPTATPRLTPTFAPTMDPRPTQQTDVPQDQLRLCWRLGWTQDYGFYFAVPCDEGETP